MNAGGQFIPPFIIYPRQKNECTIDDWCSCWEPRRCSA
jgi:hypothetical protein